MQLVYQCAICENPIRVNDSDTTAASVCSHCGTSRTLGAASVSNGLPTRCMLCGCRDLWRQKDFPPQLGLTIVGVGALASTIAWAYYWPEAAIAILMAFALLDLVLYAVMKDVLVCYRCGARYRQIPPGSDHGRFNLEVAERYRQEGIRLEEASHPTPSPR